MKVGGGGTRTAWKQQEQVEEGGSRLTEKL